MKHYTHMAKTLVAVFGLVLSALSFAAAENDLNKNDVAISGYDAVSYFTEQKAKKGKAKYSAVYNDAIYHFSSASNRDSFRQTPEKYAPQYGGYCAFGVTKHRKFSADPQAWRVVDGKLYLNLNKNVQKIWLEDVPGNIETAQQVWPEIKSTSDAYLEAQGS